MSLWIRSQDKETLVERDKLAIEKINYWKKINEVYVLNEDDDLNIYCKFIIKANDIIVGLYSTKEKSLKVLDMIETHLEYLEYKINDRNVIFQMPLDTEVEE